MKNRQELFSAAVLASIMLFAPAEAHAAGSFIAMAMNELGNYIRWLLNPPPELRVVYGILGLGCILLGPIVYRFVVSLPCGLLFAAIGAGLGAMVGGKVVAVIGGLIGLSVGLSIGWALHQLGIFIIGAWFGWLFLSAIWIAVFKSPPGGIVTVLAFLIGVIAVALSALLITVISSLIGTVLVSIAMQASGNPWMLVGLTALGVLVQSAIGRFGIGASNNEAAAEGGNALPGGVGVLIGGVLVAGQALLVAIRKLFVSGGYAAVAVAESPGASAPAWDLVVFLDGKEIFRRSLPTAATLRLGRNAEMDIVVPHDWVSGHHLDIEVGVNGLRVTDRGSRNGTWKSGRERIESDRPGDGDWYQLGTAQVLFRRA